jgi:uncharacterized protein with HEPN domain
LRDDERDLAHLWDMLDAARTIHDLLRGVTESQYLGQRGLQLAAERSISIIGEAANRVSDSFRAAHTEIPWRGMIGQRNVLVHDYGDIQQDRLWRVLRHDLPALISALEPLVPPDAG